MQKRNGRVDSIASVGYRGSGITWESVGEAPSVVVPDMEDIVMMCRKALWSNCKKLELPPADVMW